MPEFKPFCDARLKVERAKKHINDLNRELFAFLNTDFCRLSIEPDPDRPPLNCVVVRLTREVPKELGSIVGDAVHNTRAALDLIVAQAHREKTGTDSRYIKFPFYETRDRLITACKGGDIQKAGANVVNLIVDRIRPYPGGDDALCALHDLDIQDKHFLLLPHVTVAELRDAYLVDESRNMKLRMTVSLDSRGRVHIAGTSDANFEIKDHGKPAFDVLFDKGLPMEGQPIVPTLVQFTESVSRTIDLFEAL